MIDALNKILGFFQSIGDFIHTLIEGTGQLLDVLSEFVNGGAFSGIINSLPAVLASLVTICIAVHLVKVVLYGS